MRLLEAECQGGVVQVEGTTVQAEILSEGIGQSQGAALLDGNKVLYIASNKQDLKDILDQVGLVIDQIVIVLSSIDAVTTSPGSASAGITAISPLKTQLLALKEVLR